MKKIFFALCICATIIGISAIAYTNFDNNKAYAMSINDMKAITGGTVYQQSYCASRVGQCGGSCTGLTYLICLADPDPIRVCVDGNSPSQKTCDGDPLLGCVVWFNRSACTSYPY